MDFKQLQNNIGYAFKDSALLERAFTLSSVSENNNEKLECFGDAILEFIVTEKLYGECELEGDLTIRRKNVVSDESLTVVSKKLGLDKLLIKGKGDINNKKAVPSVYEALVAAIYLDGGMDETKKFVLGTIDFKACEAANDYKSRLQEIVQSYSMPLPHYSHKELGNPQAPDFSAEVKVFGRIFSGKGASVKAAEKDAARAACEYYEKNIKKLIGMVISLN